MSKIVIIEDNTLIAKLYETNLTAANHTVRISSDGADGLKLIEEFKPDILLLDLMIPEISGAEIIAELRKNSEFADLPILAYSGDEEILNAARQAGATSIISKKESSLKEIINRLEAMLSPNGQTQIAAYTGNSDTEETDKEESISIAGKRILIVEDDLLIVAIVKNIVEKAGYEAVIAGDGREAYRLLARDADFAAGIFDVHVPYIEGTDLVKQMQTEKRLMKIPVMIMTAEESVKVQLASLSAGAAFFIQKPFDRNTFEVLFKVLVNKNAGEP